MLLLAIIWILSIAFLIFTIVVMVHVLQASIAAKTYYDRENLEHWRRSLPS